MLSGKQLRKIMDGKAKALKPRLIPLPREGWIRALRDALRMSQGELAHLAGVTQSTIHRLEENELYKTIQLDSLEKLADALHCDLYYAFIPRKSLEDIYGEQALKNAKSLEARVRNTMELEAQPIKGNESRIKTVARGLMARDAVKWK